ncbi:hypothetical protein QBC43DRAFT_320022 [Cladorrhinum sp. PSN259]|nr:hypothetical protein QBC43DRAFT_320022 [Cladorrhinum sp. PSN259]
MAAEAEKVTLAQDQPQASESLATEATMPVEEKSDQAAPIVMESSKLEETVAGPSSVPPTNLSGSETKELTANANIAASALVDSGQAAEPSLPAVATAELTKESNGGAEPTVDMSVGLADDISKKLVEKPANKVSEQVSEEGVGDAVKERSRNPIKEPESARAAATEDTRVDAEMKGGADETTMKATETKPAAIGNAKRAAEEAFGADGNTDRKKSKTDTTQSTTIIGAGLAKKPGRPKKDTKLITPVGRTARKTRSQGPVEV